MTSTRKLDRAPELQDSVPAADYQALFAAAPAPFLLLSPGLTILDASDAYLAATNTERDAIRGRDLFEVFPDNPDDPLATGVANLKSSLDHVRRERQPHSMAVQRYDIRAPGGGGFEVRYWSMVNTPVLDDSGDLGYIIHRVQDSTARRRIDRLEALRIRVTEILAETRGTDEMGPRVLKAVARAFECEAGEFWALDAAGNCLRRFASWHAPSSTVRAFVEAGSSLGLHRGSGLPGRVWESGSVLQAGDGVADEVFVRGELAAAAGLRAGIGFPIINQPSDAVVMALYGSTSRLFEEELVQVTEAICRLLHEFLVREDSDQRVRAILDSVVDGIVTVDMDGRVESLNPAATRLFGLSADEIMGQGIGTLVAKSRRAEFQRYMEAVAASPDRPVSIDTHETVGVRNGGEPFPMEVTITDMRLRGRRVLLATLRDITLRREQTETRRRSEEELSRSNRGLEEFAYVASHDLQEPLRTVSGYVQLLARRYEGKLDAEADEFIAFVVDATARMKVLINDMLSFARVQSRADSVQEVDLEVVLEAVLVNLRTAIHESGAEVIHDTLPTISADSTQMIQLFQNLVGNALKFRGATPPRVSVTAARQQGDWRFMVRDNGIGIKRDYFARIFGMFQRLHTRDEYPGTGIGLALCRRIVEMHGGKIWVESILGEGTTVLFTLPGEKRASTRAEEAQP